MKHARSLLSLAASAVAVLALAVPAQAVGNGSYVIRDLRTNGCLAPLDARATSPAVLQYESGCARWTVTNQEDGSVRISPASGPGRCLTDVTHFEADAAPCGGPFQRWRIDDFGPDSPDRIFNADAGGCLTAPNPEGPVRVLSCNGPEWQLEPVK